jgi:acylphosphatase
VDKLPDGRIEVKAAHAAGNISDAFNFLKKKDGPSLSIEEMNKIAARGWARKR